ncbi:hypothetical protein [Parapedobacter sp. 2B3]|uniref:hypothetical protein n=1 Tax=Parapedobacter sp. 2B3 TaxID=3342381 RepID=UPI0035B66EC0
MAATIAELKNSLHRLVVETEDRSVLQYVEDIFKSMATTKADWWDELSEQDKKSVDRGIQQLNEGAASRHDEVVSKINALLSSRG